MENLKGLQDIEEKRRLLNNTIQVKEKLTDPEVLHISQQLDSLLNEFSKVHVRTKDKWLLR